MNWLFWIFILVGVIGINVRRNAEKQTELLEKLERNSRTQHKRSKVIIKLKKPKKLVFKTKRIAKIVKL